MLHEIRSEHREENDHSRWFQDPHWDLFVWEDADGQVERFQLCYDKPQSEKALVWKRGGKVANAEVSDGESASGRGGTQFLGDQVALDAKSLHERFTREHAGAAEPVFGLVADVLAELAEKSAK